MNRLRVSMLVVGIYLLFAVGIQAQTQKPAGARSVGAVSRPVEPDSAGSITTAAVGAQANGAGPQAIVPRLMKFGGALLDASGKPLSGAVDVTFSLYNTEAGGSPLWFETQSVQADELGRYTALLGAMHTEGLPMDLFTSGEAHWLGIQVGLEAEQQPRVLLVSVPYALKAGDAETLGGKPASAYMLSDSLGASTLATATGSSTAAATAGGSGKNNKNGTAKTSPLVNACSSVTSGIGGLANSVALFTGLCNIEDSVITQSGSNIGIGTASPSAPLHVKAAAQSGSAYPAVVVESAGNTNFWAIDSVYANTNSDLFFIPNSKAWTSATLTMQAGGNVGIGTTNPSAPLHVKSAVQGGGYPAVVIESAGDTKYWAIDSVFSSTDPDLFFIPNSKSISAATLTLQAGGNVLIGKPGALVQVAGTALVIGNLQANGSLTLGGSINSGLTVAFNATSPNIIGGYSGNIASGGVAQTISGGGVSGAVNSVTNNYGTVGGGILNAASGVASTIGGGQGNTATGDYSTIAGGSSNIASGTFATVIGGGTINAAHGDKSTIPGGESNFTGPAADHSFAAGFGAQADYTGDFVWADNINSGTLTTFASTAANQFLIRASGGVGIGTSTPQATLDTAGQDRRKPVTFSTLTACSTTIEGETAAVTDSDTNTWGATVVHTTGSFHVLAYCDGTNWTVAGK